MRETTRIQKEIESKLEGDLWDRKRIWTEKQKVYGDFLNTINTLLELCSRLEGGLVSKARTRYSDDLKFKNLIDEQWSDNLQRFLDTQSRFFTLSGVMNLFASSDALEVFNQYLSFGDTYEHGSQEWVEQRRYRLIELTKNFMPAAKKDLGLKP